MIAASKHETESENESVLRVTNSWYSAPQVFVSNRIHHVGEREVWAYHERLKLSASSKKILIPNAIILPKSEHVQNDLPSKSTNLVQHIASRFMENIAHPSGHQAVPFHILVSIVHH